MRQRIAQARPKRDLYLVYLPTYVPNGYGGMYLVQTDYPQPVR